MHLLNELALKCVTFEFVLLGVTCSVGAVLLSLNYILQMPTRPSWRGIRTHITVAKWLEFLFSDHDGLGSIPDGDSNIMKRVC